MGEAQAAEGYGYKATEPRTGYVAEPPQRSSPPEELRCGIYAHTAVNRSFLMQATEPLIIRGATDTWRAHERWDLDTLLEVCITR